MKYNRKEGNIMWKNFLKKSGWTDIVISLIFCLPLFFATSLTFFLMAFPLFNPYTFISSLNILLKMNFGILLNSI